MHRDETETLLFLSLYFFVIVMDDQNSEIPKCISYMFLDLF